MSNTILRAGNQTKKQMKKEGTAIQAHRTQAALHMGYLLLSFTVLSPLFYRYSVVLSRKNFSKSERGFVGSFCQKQGKTEHPAGFPAGCSGRPSPRPAARPGGTEWSGDRSGNPYFLAFITAFIRFSWSRMLLRMRRLLGVTSSSSSSARNSRHCSRLS